ncbi:hypothetical protein [Pseudonocardia kunmingensis]|uniref:ACT domain-containing protein n=1 Tax=Pseudonocardia kunmingensis TaxID=630975 RepID=A0A543DY16_9PSEU|nr:hypothetical protein [Pseudonocardia kunmingensis]TQM14149.1 hypothetical protein FB558_0907 [Pseudonocardia kunmingensis]
MSVLDHQSPRATWAPRLQRRHEIVTTGGMQGVLDIASALRAGGFPVREFTVEVRDGVPYSSVTCTVSLTAAECAGFADRLGAVPAVVSVEPC